MTDPPQAETRARRYQDRWPDILIYPMQPGALSTIIALAVVHTAVGWLPSIVGGFFDLIVWAAFFKYGFEVLRWSANGRENAPEISFTVSEGIGGYAVLLLLLVEIALSLIGSWYGLLPTLAFGLLMMLAVPAIVTVLAVDEDPIRAINPFAWTALAMRLGRTYFVLVGFFFAALFVQSAVAAALAGVRPAFLATLMVGCLVNYLMIATFHLIGWIIHEHADELGYTGHLELKTLAADAGPDERIVETARNRAASGDVDAAIALLRDEIAVRPEALPLHEEYRHWLKQVDQQGELLANAKHYIPALLARDRFHDAVDVARESYALDPGFALDKAEDVTRLGAAAAVAGQSQLALDVLAGFHKRFRNHSDIARNYLLAAKIMAERMNREMQARALLQQIRIVLPHDPLIPDVEAYLAFLDQLSATPAKPPPAG